MSRIAICSDLRFIEELPSNFLLCTCDVASSLFVFQSPVFNEIIGDKYQCSRKRKSPSDKFFGVYIRDEVKSAIFLAKDDCSLTMNSLAVLRKTVIEILAGKATEMDRLYIFAATDESRRIACAIAVMLLLSMKDDLLLISNVDINTKVVVSVNNGDIIFDSSPDVIETVLDGQHQRGSDLENCISKALCALLETLPWKYSENETFFMRRLIFTSIKDKQYMQGLKRMHHELGARLADANESRLSTLTAASDEETKRKVPSQPPAGEGWRVFEFFSGIGGMRLGLPDQIDGKPVTKITALDCNTIANNVYEYNFHHRRDPLRHPANIQDSKLQTMLVQHLSVQAADNAADIWTMSPPCQPFTQTRRARQLDEKDNRSQGLYHLMTLLLRMRHMPRYIMVENVRGFLRSKMHALWCQVLRRCGYRYHEFLLSPDKTVLLPNSRTRYYCIARFDEKYGELPRAVVPSNKESIEDNRELEFMQNNPLTVAEAVTSNSDTLGLQPPDQDADANSDDESPENDPTSSQEYGYHLSSIPPSLLMEDSPVRSIGAVLGECYHQVNSSGESTLQQLYVPMDILQSSWASKMLSIARISDCLTYCFTKGYGKRVDHSAGSCLFIDDERELNRSDLPSYYKRIRLFHPDELLLLFGFPAAYAFPTSVNKSVSSTTNVDRTAKCLTLQHRWGCIGNSVNVFVIRLVMRCLFEDPLWEQL